MAGKFNAKSFIVDHGEKVALGFSAAMALYFAAFGGRWSSYTGTPQEIHANVQAGKRALEGHGWPQEENDLYKLTDQNKPKQIVEENLRQPILAENFPLSTRFVTSPWQGREPLRQPELLALEELIVDGGKVFIEIPVDPTATEDPMGEGSAEGDSALAATDKPVEEDDEFGTRGGGQGAANGLSGESMVLPGGLPGTLSETSPEGPGFDPLSSPYSGDLSGMMGMESGMGAAAMNRAGQGYLYASVRAVFPLRAQITKYQEATGARTWQAAAQNFDLIDFKLERQEQTNAEQDSWSEWAPVDLQAANDVLDQTVGPEPDVVAGSVTNNVITMPLPTRVMGLWKKHASHPRIDNFELTEEEIQQEVDLNARMLELARDSKKATDKLMKPKTEKGGFSNRMADSRALQASVFGGDPYGMGMGMGMESPAYGGGSPSGMMTSPAMGMGGHGGPTPRPGVGGPAGAKRGQPQDRPEMLMAKILSSDDKSEQNKTLAEYIRKTITVSGELLLFRYIDFDVKPGKTYRYRARLVLNNPNFGRNASEAEGVTSVVEAETFQTDWSKTTPGVTIERDVHYFVKDVDPQRGRTALTVYQWDTEKGTTINADLDLYPGSYIAGKTKTRVIDAAKMTNEEKADYEFKSKDVFVDSRPDVALIDKNLHKNLKMPGGGRGDALLPEEVLVVQAATGELTLLDPVRQAEDQKKMSALVGRQNKAYENVGQTAVGMDMMGMEMGMGMGMEGSPEGMVSPEMSGMPMGKKSSRKKRNPLASGFPGGSSLPGAAGGMAGHGGGGGGGHGAAAGGGKKPPRGSRPNAP